MEEYYADCQINDSASSTASPMPARTDLLSEPPACAPETPSLLTAFLVNNGFDPHLTARSSRDGESEYSGEDSLAFPGVFYYQEAIRIMDIHGIGDDLQLAQTSLLAGIFASQLAWDEISSHWFNKAGGLLLSLLADHALLIVDSNEATLYVKRAQFWEDQDVTEDKTRCMIILAAWSCLRLEDAGSARAPYPSSSLHGIKENLPVPPSLFRAGHCSSSLPTTLVSAKDSYDSVFLVHLAQIAIENQLRHIHCELHGDGYLNVSPGAMRIILREHRIMLHRWRTNLPRFMRWDDRDPPPSDFLLARLRATYWQAMHEIDKPALDHFLDHAPLLNC